MSKNETVHDNKAAKKPPVQQVEDPQLDQELIPQATVQLARMDPDSLSPKQVLQLQRTIGNTTVINMLIPRMDYLNNAMGLTMPRIHPTVQRKSNLVQRGHAEDLEDMASAGEQEQQQQMRETPPPAMQVNNITDANEARALMNEIERNRDRMQEGGTTGTIPGSQISANEGAIATLADYLVTVGEQGRTLSTFQQQLKQVREDYGRVSGQMIHLEAMGVVTRGESATFRAEQTVGAATGAGSAAESAAGMTGNAENIREHASRAHDALIDKGHQFSVAQENATRAVHGVNSALNTLNAGIIPREEDPELAAQHRAIKAKVSTMQSRLSTGLTVISAIGGAAGLGSAATAAATRAVGSTATSLGTRALSGISPDTIATAISEIWYRTQVNAIESQIAAANAASREAAITANISGLREAQTAMFSALNSLSRKLTEYQQARDTLRTTLDNLGAAADRSAGDEGYSIIAGLLGDVDVLVVQIDTTMGLGRTEEFAAGHATGARARVEGTRSEETGRREGGVTYYRPYRNFQLSGLMRSGGLVWKARACNIFFVTLSRLPGSAYGGTGAANPVVRTTLEELQEMRTTVQGMRSVLASSMGLSMER